MGDLVGHLYQTFLSELSSIIAGGESSNLAALRKHVVSIVRKETV